MLRVFLFVAFGLLGASCGPAPAIKNEVQEIAPTKLVRNAFPQASEVRLFVETDVDANGKSVFSKPEGLKLSPTERQAFEASLVVEPVPDMVIGCFIPHHFFRYFDTSGRKVGEIAVCFCCGGVVPSGAANIPIAKDQRLGTDYKKLEAFVRSLGEPTQVQCGTTD